MEAERWQYHVEHSVPSLEDTLRAVAENHYLSAVIGLCHVHKAWGMGGVDALDRWVACPTIDDNDDNAHRDDQLDLAAMPTRMLTPLSLVVF